MLSSGSRDKEFHEFKQLMLKVLKIHPRFGTLVLRNQLTGRDQEIQPGQPLYEILFTCFLACDLRHESLDNKNKVMTELKAYAALIHEWLEWLVSNFDNEQINEFHQAQKFYGNTAFIFNTIECVTRELTESTSFGYNYDINQLIGFANNFHLMQKLISKDDSKIYGKKYEVMKRVLATAKFEACFNKTILHIKNKNYIVAETYANKAFESVGGVCPTERSYLRCCVLINLAYIKAQQNDHESAIQYLNEFLKIKDQKKNKLDEYPVHDHYFIKACEFVAEYYVKLGKADMAIKYLLSAMDIAREMIEEARLKRIMIALIPNLTTQVSEVACSENFKAIISEVKPYPAHSLVYLYFDNSQCAAEVKSQLAKNEVTVRDLKTAGQKEGFAIQFSYDFDLDVFIRILDRAKQRLEKTIRAEQRAIQPKSQNDNNATPAAVSATERASYIKHPKTATKKTKKKAANPVEQPIKAQPRWQFLESMRPAPLQVVKFKNYEFDPKQPNGVVTLRVNNMSGKWFAIINPDLANELPGNEELLKIIQRFQTETELGNDCCVPCAKEMKTKEKELGADLPYLFKIRLMGKGNGDIRIYARIIDVTEDGKTLVAFTAINPKAHSKDSRPIEVPLVEKVVENEVRPRVNL